MNPADIRALSYRAPDNLHQVLQQQMRAAAPVAAARGIARRQFAAVALAWAASLLVVATWNTNPGEDALVRDVVAGHVRSMMADHLTDVPSSDRHTVKPWFGGKLDFSPLVADTTADGFPLVGGRLDYLSGRPVAAVVYRRQQHVINLFTWPAAKDDDSPPRTLSRQGYQIIEWSRAGMSYWLVSDLNGAELQALAERIRSAG
ncbi:MAG TPA: anti-sigma factor [Candidatus Binatia bacterium]|jgi:anti-sigma factor RsiW